MDTVRSRWSATWIVAGAVVAVLAMSAGITWAHSFIAKSHVTIQYVGFFKGNVSSKQAACFRSRKVTVRQVVDGPDPSLGSSQTNRLGNWNIEASVSQGFFYAQASFKRVRKPGHDH